jgi:hypothetical protein
MKMVKSRDEFPRNERYGETTGDDTSPEGSDSSLSSRRATGIRASGSPSVSFEHRLSSVSKARSPPSSRTPSLIYRNTTPASLRSPFDSNSEDELVPVPLGTVAVHQQQDQYYGRRQGSPFISSGESSFGSLERSPRPPYDNSKGRYPDYHHGRHPRLPTGAANPKPPHPTHGHAEGSSADETHINMNLDNRKRAHPPFLWKNNPSTSHHGSGLIHGPSTKPSSSAQPDVRRIHGSTRNNNGLVTSDIDPWVSENEDQQGADAQNKKGGKSHQDQRLYAAGPHLGPLPTDWMLPEETLRSRAAREARFAQIVAMGSSQGRTKAGWAQTRPPGKRDRDAAKKKLREIEEKAEEERLKALLDEGRPSSID